MAETDVTRLRALDYRRGHVRKVGFRGRWLLRPTSSAAAFPDGVRYGIAVDEDGWVVVSRSGSDGGVVPTLRWYADASAAAADGVPETALGLCFAADGGRPA